MHTPASSPGATAAPLSTSTMAAQWAVAQVVQNWGLWRDTGDWEQLRASYAPGAWMRTTWFDGSAEDFIDMSIRKFDHPSLVQHFMAPATTRVHGRRAIAETRLMLMVRDVLHDVEVDIVCYGRFVDRLILDDDRWRIQDRTPIYEKDTLTPTVAGRSVPLDPARFMRHPVGYRHLAYLQSLGGRTIITTLPAHNSAEQRMLYKHNTEWLQGD